MVLEDPTLEKHGNLSRVKPQYTFETVTLPIKKNSFHVRFDDPKSPFDLHFKRSNNFDVSNPTHVCFCQGVARFCC